MVADVVVDAGAYAGAAVLVVAAVAVKGADDAAVIVTSTVDGGVGRDLKVGLALRGEDGNAGLTTKTGEGMEYTCLI